MSPIVRLTDNDLDQLDRYFTMVADLSELAGGFFADWGPCAETSLVGRLRRLLGDTKGATVVLRERFIQPKCRADQEPEYNTHNVSPCGGTKF